MHYDARHRRPLAVGHMMRGRAERKGGGILRVRCCRQRVGAAGRAALANEDTRRTGTGLAGVSSSDVRRQGRGCGCGIPMLRGMAPARSERTVVRRTDRMDRGWDSADGGVAEWSVDKGRGAAARPISAGPAPTGRSWARHPPRRFATLRHRHHFASPPSRCVRWPERLPEAAALLSAVLPNDAGL